MRVLWPKFKRTVDGTPGLIIVILQHTESGQVLMVAFTDEDGWRNTLKSGYVHLFSTSRKKSCMKGEQSGNRMKVTDSKIDCDGDTVVLRVKPEGNGQACHTNADSCFYRFPLDLGLAFYAPGSSEAEHLDHTEADVAPEILQSMGKAHERSWW